MAAPFVAAAPAIGAAAGSLGKGVSTATILTAAGAGLSAVGAVQQGIAANQQSKFQAAVMRQQAERERQVAEAEETEFRDRQQRLMARRRAIMGGSGFSLSEGSPLLTSEDFAGEVELQALKIRNKGDVRSTRLDQQANLTAFEGRAKKRAGFVRGGASLLSGAGQAFA